MPLRQIVYLLTGLLLGGCMQATIDPASDANLSPRDRKLLANAPYVRVQPPLEYQRSIVQYHRKEAPGSIVIDTDARYLYLVLKDNQAIRYGAVLVRHCESGAQRRMAELDADCGHQAAPRQHS